MIVSWKEFEPWNSEVATHFVHKSVQIFPEMLKIGYTRPSFFILIFSTGDMLFIKFCWCPDSKRRPLVPELTALPTEPQLLQYWASTELIKLGSFN